MNSITAFSSKITFNIRVNKNDMACIAVFDGERKKEKARKKERRKERNGLFLQTILKLIYFEFLDELQINTCTYMYLIHLFIYFYLFFKENIRDIKKVHLFLQKYL